MPPLIIFTVVPRWALRAQREPIAFRLLAPAILSLPRQRAATAPRDAFASTFHNAQRLRALSVTH